jgi:hypothetical protein
MGGEGEGERARFEQRGECLERVLQRHSTTMMRKRVWGEREKEMGGGSPRSGRQRSRRATATVVVVREERARLRWGWSEV